MDGSEKERRNLLFIRKAFVLPCIYLLMLLRLHFCYLCMFINAFITDITDIVFYTYFVALEVDNVAIFPKCFTSLGHKDIRKGNESKRKSLSRRIANSKNGSFHS